MVYLKSVFSRATVVVALIALTVLLTLTQGAEGATAKIAYKKPIHGKPNAIREHSFKQKPAMLKTTSAKTPTIAALLVQETTAAPTTPMSAIASSGEEAQQQQIQVDSTIWGDSDTTEMASETGIGPDEKTTDDTAIEEKNNSNDNSAPGGVIETPIVAAISTPTTEPSREPVACTCGIFMASQVRRGASSNEPPIGHPVIVNELDRTYPCNAIGQKQCQTKCLETIVQHLPNSASILCATLNRDCRKERAYLFIKNCRNQWWNTTLTAGREYCCKGGQPYACPLV